MNPAAPSFGIVIAGHGSRDPEADEERKALQNYADLLDKQVDVKGRLKAAETALETKIVAKYGKLIRDIGFQPQ